ncbi:uncharacterized protein C16orf86 homolog [Echinops telfairi]|uniref:Uncharacterized protein C16orf86 homolog n=1 Tax=Echinops telfairi TaxID=9371 RepID=A0ABM0IPM7_ECHTE|nr:uncharacterized protein C16orf86 homolog [Echinops telfairi]
MASAGAERRSGPQEGSTLGSALIVEAPAGCVQSSEIECPVSRDQRVVPAYKTCLSQEAKECPAVPVPRPEVRAEQLKPKTEGPEGRGLRALASVVRQGQGLKRKPVKAEVELPSGLLLLQKDESARSPGEPSPSSSAKQHKKTKKRKSLGPPALLATVSTLPAPAEALGLERRAQRLRPLYQYINYCNPELNQAGKEDREAGAGPGPEPELKAALAPEEADVEHMQALLPVAGETGSGPALPCPQMLVPPTHMLAPLAEDAGEEAGFLPDLGVSGQLKAEMDKSTQVDISKMLRVCAAPLVPPLSPQYK